MPRRSAALRRRFSLVHRKRGGILMKTEAIRWASVSRCLAYSVLAESRQREERTEGIAREVKIPALCLRRTQTRGRGTLLFILCPAPRSRRLLLDLRFGLIGRLLLVLQRFFRRRIGRRRRYIGRSRAGVGRLGHTVGALFFCQFAQAVVELLREVVLHLLQIIHFHGYGLPGGTVRLLARRDARIDRVIGIGSVGQAGEDVTRGQPALLAVRHDGEIVVDDKGPSGRIKRRRNFIACRSRRWSGRRWRRGLAARPAILIRLRLLRCQLRAPFASNRLFALGRHSYRGRTRSRCRRISAVVTRARRRVGSCLLTGRIGRLQLGCDQIIREPERRPRIVRIRREPAAVEAIPRRSAPTP